MPISFATSNANWVLIASLVIAVLGTILSLLLVTPDRRRAKNPKPINFLADIFNMRQLLIEKILKCIYIFATIGSFFFFLFGAFAALSYGGSYGGYSFALNLLCAFVAPIAIRLAYELLMFPVILVKNVIEINNKLLNKQAKEEKEENSKS